jgi:phenylacetyl-CoA:acceptor oxidoreductase subunit 2
MSYGPRPWQQTNWDWRAAGNFIFGGAGSGLLLATAFVLPLGPARSVALLLGCALVGLGLFSVWLEIGRPLRALHVFFNPWTSWMTREAFAGSVLLGIAAFAFFWPGIAAEAALGASAAVYAWCQGRILMASKGITAWRAPELVPLMLATALAEGAGFALLFDPGSRVLTLFAIAVIMRATAWSGYWAALEQPGGRAALEPAGKALIQIGTLAPLALLLAAFYIPAAAPLAGVAAIAAGWRFKYVLVTRAAFNQGFALPQLPVRGTR